MADSPKILVPYSEAAPQIRDADLLLWRPHGDKTLRGRIARGRGWVTAQLTRGEHCHASKAAWKECVVQTEPRGVAQVVRSLMTIGTEEGRGGIEEPLEPLVRRYPGRIDVYETNPENRWPEYDRAGAVAWIRKHGVGQDYGWRATLRCALSRVIILRWLPWFSPNRDDDANGRPPNCSALCAASDYLGGNVDPVPGLSNNATEPVNLATSMFYRYRFTPVPDRQEG